MMSFLASRSEKSGPPFARLVSGWWWKVELPLFPMTWTDKLFKPDHNFQPTSNLRRVWKTL